MASTPVRSSARLRKGVPDPPTPSVQDKKSPSMVKTVYSQTGRKRPRQIDNEDAGPSAKRTVSKSALKSSTKSTSEASRTASIKLNARLMEVYQKQQQTSDETQEPEPQDCSTSSNRLLRPEKSTLLKSAQTSRSQSPIVLPGFIDHELAARLAKNTGRRVTFAPQPYKKPSRRLPKSPTKMPKSLNYVHKCKGVEFNTEESEFQDFLTNNQLQTELAQATPPLDSRFAEHTDGSIQPYHKTTTMATPHASTTLPLSFSNPPKTTADLESYFAPHPLLPRTDREFEQRYRHLKAAAWRWAKQYFSQAAQAEANSAPVDLPQLSKQCPELMEYVGYIASPEAGKDWESVFSERRAPLVYGILGKVIEVHVLGHEMFGCTDSQLKALRMLDLELIDGDGFTRQNLRATTISSFLPHPTSLPPLYLPHLHLLTHSLAHLLSPLLPQPQSPPTYKNTLSHLLLLATKLSLDLRRSPHTIYHTTPAPAKNSSFSPQDSHALNARSLYIQHRKLTRTGALAGRDQIVRLACWPSLTAYRPGTPSSTSADDEPPGIRTRVIGRAECVCEWSYKLTAQACRANGLRERLPGVEKGDGGEGEGVRAGVVRRVGWGLGAVGVMGGLVGGLV